MPPDTQKLTAPSRALSKRKTSVLPQMDQILAADRELLTSWWRQLFGGDVPKGLSQAFLRRFIAFEVQSRAQGGLPSALVAQIARIDTKTERKSSRTLKPGGRLLREWGGVTLLVEVTAEGCHWNGQTHRSLSAVARAITGAQWSGPRFFGLAAAEKATKQSGASAAKRSTQGKGQDT